mmetsp:Transcript_51141/g.165559  ORF Transcript_51141/g.165559 Transcript_51141/m.165559 type:complete len:370 (+) Transcript_51141:1174-2283(+)
MSGALTRAPSSSTRKAMPTRRACTIVLVALLLRFNSRKIVKCSPMTAWRRLTSSDSVAAAVAAALQRSVTSAKFEITRSSGGGSFSMPKRRLRFGDHLSTMPGSNNCTWVQATAACLNRHGTSNDTNEVALPGGASAALGGYNAPGDMMSKTGKMGKRPKDEKAWEGHFKASGISARCLSSAAQSSAQRGVRAARASEAACRKMLGSEKRLRPACRMTDIVKSPRYSSGGNIAELPNTSVSAASPGSASSEQRRRSPEGRTMSGAFWQACAIVCNCFGAPVLFQSALPNEAAASRNFTHSSEPKRPTLALANSAKKLAVELRSLPNVLKSCPVSPSNEIRKSAKSGRSASSQSSLGDSTRAVVGKRGTQ